MDEGKAIKLLEGEWEQLEGFLGCMRDGKFDPAGFRRFERLLRSIQSKLSGRFLNPGSLLDFISRK